MKKVLLALALIFSAMSINAQEWSKDLEKTAKGGDATAQYEVGLCYYNGTGVAKNEKKAAQWFAKSAALGNEEARKMLYSFYSKDLEKIAKKGDAEAQYHLAMSLYNGVGIEKDTETAAKWFDSAKNNGHVEARNMFYSYESSILKKRVRYVPLNKFDGVSESNYNDENVNHYVIFDMDYIQYDGQYGFGVKDNSYIEYYNGNDSICGYVKGNSLVDATWNHKGRRNSIYLSGLPEDKAWKYEGNINFDNSNSFASYIFQNINSSKYPWEPSEWTFCQGGTLTIPQAEDGRNNKSVQNSAEYPYWESSMDIKCEIPYDVVRKQYNMGEFKFLDPQGKEFKLQGKGTFMVRRGWWAQLFGPDVFTNMTGKYGSDAYGLITYEYDMKTQKAQIKGFKWALPNNAVIAQGIPGIEGFVYYSPVNGKPINIEEGSIIAQNGTRIEWEPAGTTSDIHNLSHVKIVTAEGDSIDVVGETFGFNFIYNKEDRWSLANGKPTYMYQYEAREAGEHNMQDYILLKCWQYDGFGNYRKDVNGTIKYANGTVEKVVEGQTESDIKRDQEAAKRQAAAEKKAYEEKCKKYGGKQYVDAAADGRFIKGTHIDLIQEYCKNTLNIVQLDHYVTYDDGASVYYLESYKGTIARIYFNANKKVESITYH